MKERVRFEKEDHVSDGHGGSDREWVEHYSCRADVSYNHGKEAVQTGSLTGSAVFTFKIRQCAEARAIKTVFRVVDVRRNTAYNIREVDSISDQRFIWIKAESGVAI